MYYIDCFCFNFNVFYTCIEPGDHILSKNRYPAKLLVFWEKIIHAQLLNVADDEFSYLQTENDRQLHLESIAKIHWGTHILLSYACNWKEYDLLVLCMRSFYLRRSSIGKLTSSVPWLVPRVDWDRLSQSIPSGVS
jgi:hypothetical protein